MIRKHPSLKEIILSFKDDISYIARPFLWITP
jgi:hypothetical protein